MKKRLTVAQQATADIEQWLSGLEKIQQIINVENEPFYQEQDIDLLWISTQGKTYTIEIKGDTYSGDRNFFLETKSNEEKGTLGCFLYTQANYVFYYFIKPRKLYILPMPRTREWFLNSLETFREARTETTVGTDYYTTVGRLVPIQMLVTEVPQVKFFQL